VCLFVLNAAIAAGFWQAMGAVAAVTLTDAAYIALSALGASALFRKPAVRGVARKLGGAVLCVFGLDMALGALGIRLIPGVRLFAVDTGGSTFWQTLALTASNPLTILFWGGALAARVSTGDLRKRGLLGFACGCVLATAVFLTTVAALGGALMGRLDGMAISVMNMAVGVALVYFGVRLACKHEPVAAAPTACQGGGVSAPDA
jgi:threonine/homoserine/homoserine lactone efflux protein